ncbi:MAG: hypothetical protein JNL90_03900 [Planctomycetes bacterium]|nr:hypothetical protein [Planctomycetota bacterium]
MVAAGSTLLPALLALALATAQEPPAAPPAASSAGALPPAAPLVGKPVEREQRLALQRAALDATIARAAAFGHIDEFAAALRALKAKPIEPVAGDEAANETDDWRNCARGWLPRMAIDHWLAWHLPAPDKRVPRAIDFDFPNHPYHAIVDLAKQLHAHDIEFVLVLFPSRLQLYPELVDAAFDPARLGESEAARAAGGAAAFPGMVGATAQFLRALNEAGVETLDLAPPFVAARADGGPELGEIYLQRNKHWTPRAAELAARLVAERLSEQAWFVPGSSIEGKVFEVMRRKVDIGGAAGGQAPDTTPEKLALHQVRQLGARVNPAEVRGSPIVLLGDSFARFYSDHGASFGDQLRRFTGHPIDALTPMGGGELQCREQLARRDDRMRGKKVVVWLLQEDNLLPNAQWKKVALFDE